MFRSLASSLISLLAILLFAFTLLFLWTGSEGVKFTRVTLDGDKSTEPVLEDYRRANMQTTEVAMDEKDDEDEKPEPVATNAGDCHAGVVGMHVAGFRACHLD